MAKVTKLKSIKKEYLSIKDHLIEAANALYTMEPDLKDTKVAKTIILIQTEEGTTFPAFHPSVDSATAIYMLEMAKLLILDAALDASLGE